MAVVVDQISIGIVFKQQTVALVASACQVLSLGEAHAMPARVLKAWDGISQVWQYGCCDGHKFRSKKTKNLQCCQIGGRLYGHLRALVNHELGHQN